jgi:hypothetical protein
VDEYWVCQHCRSLNRASSGRCYSCGAKFGSKPKEAAPTKRNQPAPGAPPPPPPSPPVSFAQRSNPSQGSSGPSEPPAYLSTPVAVQPAPYLTETRQGGRLPNVLSPIETRVSRALAVRPVVSVAGLGYATALLLITLFVAGGLMTLTGLHGATYALQHADLPGGWNQLTTDQKGLIETMAFSVAVISLATLLFFSLFIGLSTHNTSGLGAEATLLTPRSGGTVWFRLVWVQVRLGVGILLPTLLVWYGYQLPGLIVAVIVVEIAQRHVDDMLDWLDRPARHLPDLYRKLGVQGARQPIVATMWAALFRTANLALVAAFAVAPLALSIDEAMKATGNELDVWRTSGYGPGQLALGAVFVVLAISSALCLLATIAVTFGLVSRQRTRWTQARVGRSRSWLARPGEGAYGAVGGARGAAMAQAAGAAGAGAAGAAGGFGAVPGGAAFGGIPNGYGDDDRFVDRYPNGTLPPGFSEDDTFASRVAEARGEGLDAVQQAPGWPGAPAQQPMAPQQPAAWPGARPPQPGQQFGQQTDQFPQPLSGWPGAQPQQPTAPPQPAAWPGAPPAQPGAWPGAQPQQPVAPPQPAAWPGAPPAQPAAWPGAQPQQPMAPQQRMPAMQPPPVPPQPQPAQSRPGPQPQPAGWPAQRPTPGPQTPQSPPPGPQSFESQAPAWAEPEGTPESSDPAGFGRSTDPVAELGRVSELPRPPEGWTGPKPGGLLHRMGAQMGSAPGSPPDAGDQASLNSPSTTSSASSPDDVSDSPSD